MVIVNSRFLDIPQKRSRGDQLIHRHLTKTKSIGCGQNPESQASRLPWWIVFGIETGREVWGRGWIKIGFAKEQRRQSGLKYGGNMDPDQRNFNFSREI